MPSLGSVLPLEKPIWSVSIRKALMPLCFFSGAVMVNNRIVSATGAEVTHDLRPLTDKLRALSVQEQRLYSFTFVGMNAKAQQRIKDLYADLSCEIILLPRFETIDGLFSKYRECDLGIVSLRQDYCGIVCPSKAFSYVSQGLPLFYVGPANTMSWNLCKQGWGYTLEDWFGVARDLARKRMEARSGTIFPSPKSAGRAAVLRLLRDNV